MHACPAAAGSHLLGEVLLIRFRYRSDRCNTIGLGLTVRQPGKIIIFVFKPIRADDDRVMTVVRPPRRLPLANGEGAKSWRSTSGS
jgi:hypothetical protein